MFGRFARACRGSASRNSKRAFSNSRTTRTAQQSAGKNTNSSNTNTNSGSGESGFKSAWQRFTGPRTEHARYTSGWWIDKSIVMVVFACTGSTTAYVVRPILSKYLHIEGLFDARVRNVKFLPRCFWRHRLFSHIFLSFIFVVNDNKIDDPIRVGSFKEGPWSYRIVSLVAMMPIYSLLLVSFGTLAGRHVYFKKFAANMWTRMFFMKQKK
jgi:hypothetical protein